MDCFAGPWATEKEDLADTSIGISLSILNTCKMELDKRGTKLRFRALYIEKDDEAFARLDRFLKANAPAGIEAQCFHGDFVELRQDILDWCGSEAFAFFFVDPTGWKEVSAEVLRPLLRRQGSEFLINFMYDFVNRTASMAEWRGEIAALLGEAVEVEEFHGTAREKILVDTYRKNLKRELPVSHRRSARSAHVRVLDRKKERPKYHLVYLTTHPRGIAEFMEISENLDQIQKRVRASTKQAARVTKSRQSEMFDESALVDLNAGDIHLTEVERCWMSYLSGGERRVGVDEFADLLEETGWFPGDLQRALARLIAAGRVRNLDAKRTRPKQPLHWKHGERLTIVERSV